MNIEELIASKKHQEHIRRFVNDDLFKDIALAFVMHTPNGDDKNPDSTAVAHGKNLGTRYAFEHLERVAKTPPPQQKPSKPKSDTGGSRDPDLS